MNTILTFFLFFFGYGLASPIAQFGRFMYWVFTFGFIFSGLAFLTVYWFKHRRYYKKGLLNLGYTLITLSAGLVLFIIGLVMLFY